MKPAFRFLTLFALLATLNFYPALVKAQGTAFTYQGRLNNLGVPVNGSYDVSFTLFATNVTGTPLSGPLTNTAVGVTNGLFTTVVDFGNVYAGASNWLEIAVSPHGANTFNKLAPRQQLTPVPYAITAANLSGTLPLTQLPVTVLTNGAGGVNLNGTFAGSGSGLTNVWRTSGNSGTTAGVNYLGTADNQPLELWANGARALRLEPDTNTFVLSTKNAPNVIGGSPLNYVNPGTQGASIGGGGGTENIRHGISLISILFSNQVAGDYGTVGGGNENTASGFAATVPGGNSNLALGLYSLAAGQQAQATNQGAFVWADSQSGPFSSTNNDSFNVRAQGGVVFATSGSGVQVDGASVLTATAGAIQGYEINDGGSAAYQTFQAAAQTVGGDTSLGFANLSPVMATNGVSPAFSLTINGSAFGSVIGFSGSEGISSPYEYVVEVTNSTAIANLDTEIGLTGSLSFTRNGLTTTFGGIVTSCALAAGTSGFLYVVKIEPSLAYLALTTDYNIYQTKTAPAVATLVYQALAPNPALTTSLSTYPIHQSLTQYGETSLNFFSRLLENEGIFYFFNQSVSPPSLILGDNTTAYLSAPNSPWAYYGNGPTNIAGGGEYIQTFQKASHQTTLKSTVDASGFLAPSTDLTKSSSATTGAGEYFEFGNAVETADYDTQLALVRKGMQVAKHAAMAGSATAPDLRAGYTFTITDQTSAGLGGNYVATSVHHAGFVRVTNGVSTYFYGNEFEAIPANLVYRPPLKTPKPHAAPTTATVTGQAGEEINVDNTGRAKVLFHWDRYDSADDTSSEWVPVASPWAGNGRGMIFSPRVGDEVLVSFMDGDPDRPIITGSLYNTIDTPPFSLPGNKTRSGFLTESSPNSTGFNELMFEDKAGNEQIYMHAQKDYLMDVLNNWTANITGALTFNAGSQINLNSAVAVTGNVTANGTFNGNGSGLTGLNASQVANAATLTGNQTFTGVNTFSGNQSGGFLSPFTAIVNNNTSSSSSPALRVMSYGNTAGGALSVSSQGTGLIAQFGNGITFVADIATNGTVDATGFNGGSLRVGTTGTTYTTIQSGQAIMPSSNLVATNFTINFPQAFTSIPKVIASLSGDPGFPNASDTFAMSIRAITTTTGFTINVYRVDAPTGWSQQLRVNWQAWQ